MYSGQLSVYIDFWKCFFSQQFHGIFMVWFKAFEAGFHIVVELYTLYTTLPMCHWVTENFSIRHGKRKLEPQRSLGVGTPINIGTTPTHVYPEFNELTQAISRNILFQDQREMSLALRGFLILSVCLLVLQLYMIVFTEVCPGCNIYQITMKQNLLILDSDMFIRSAFSKITM